MTAKIAFGWDVKQAIDGFAPGPDLSTDLIHYWGLSHGGGFDRGACSYENRSPSQTDDVSGVSLAPYVGFGGGTMLQAMYNAPTMSGWSATGFSVSYWFKPISGCPPDVGRFVYWNIPPTYLTYIFYGGAARDQGKIILYDDVGGYVISPGNLVGLSSAWHHLMVTYDPSDRKGRIYSDGSIFSTTAALGVGRVLRDSQAQFAIGWDGYTLYAGYEIDDVAIWKRPLGATHAAALYAGATYPY